MGKVKLSEFEWKLCALALGYDRLLGFPEYDLNLDEGDRDEVRKSLLEKNMLEEKEGNYQFTPLCQYFFRIMHEADAWIMVEKEENHFVRRIYVKGADYLSVEGQEQEISLLLLPLLPLAVGAIADAVGEDTGDVRITGCSGSSTLELTPEKLKEYSIQDCVNFITVWLLKGLGEGGDQDGR